MLMTGADLAGARPLSTPDTFFTGSGFGGRGWVSVGDNAAGTLWVISCDARPWPRAPVHTGGPWRPGPWAS